MGHISVLLPLVPRVETGTLNSDYFALTTMKFAHQVYRSPGQATGGGQVTGAGQVTRGRQVTGAGQAIGAGQDTGRSPDGSLVLR